MTRHFLSRLGPGSRRECLVALAAVCILLSATCLTAQTPRLASTLARVINGEEFKAQSFGPSRWLDGGGAYTTVEPSSVDRKSREIVRYETATGRRQVMISASRLFPEGASAPLTLDHYAWSADMKRLLIFTNTARVWRLPTRGDYWVLDLATNKLQKVGGGAPPQSLMFAKFSPDGTKVAYVRANNIYVEDLATAQITPITQDGSETIINGSSDWVYEEEFFLRDAFRWSPDGRRIAFWRFDTSGVRDFPLLYNTGGQHVVVTHIPYPEFGVYPTIQHIPYPQPGTANSAVRIGVANVTGGPATWMNVTGDPHDTYIARMEWAGNSDELVLEHLNRLQNTNDVLLANASSGAIRELFRDKDKAWLDVVDKLEWLDEGKELLWLSERDGWRHAFAVSRETGQARLITQGQFDVIEIEAVDLKDGWLYFIASPDNGTQRYLYRTRLAGQSSAERLTPPDSPGTHSYDMSPDCHWAVHRHSTFQTPPVIDLVQLPNHQTERVLQDNHELRGRLKSIEPGPVEFFQVGVGKGVKLDAYVMKPPHFDPGKKYPIVVFVYGEPAAQTVLDEWQGRNTLFHYALANEGYLIASFDNQGTPAPKGRDWRKIIYGSVGVLSSKQQADALQAVESARPYIDASRVAVWGASGGGSNTLNLMFRHPEVYKVGVAVSPVPDQRLYDTIYQERYMGLPQDNAEGYKAGSPINFAEGLAGRLLIVHGSGDDNVHYQGTELLLNRLIELGKQFDFMEYPNRTHGLSEGEGTELHLYMLLARFLEQHVPPGSVPQ